MVLAQRVGSPELHITGRVLLVDPDLGTHTAVDGVLAEMGFELDLACDLEEGLTLLKATLVDPWARRVGPARTRHDSGSLSHASHRHDDSR